MGESGIYVRITRRGKWKSVLIDNLTTEEFITYLDNLPHEEDSRNWAIFLFRHAFGKE